VSLLRPHEFCLPRPLRARARDPADLWDDAFCIDRVESVTCGRRRVNLYCLCETHLGTFIPGAPGCANFGMLYVFAFRGFVRTSSG